MKIKELLPVFIHPIAVYLLSLILTRDFILSIKVFFGVILFEVIICLVVYFSYTVLQKHFDDGEK